MKDFDSWNEKKKKINSINKNVYFKERDIFFVNLGKNIGHEEDGKGIDFIRPVVVLRKFNNRLFMAVPLTTNSHKNNQFYFQFKIKKNNKINNAILSQIRLIDKNRIINKIGIISKDDFQSMKNKISRLLKLDI